MLEIVTAAKVFMVNLAFVYLLNNERVTNIFLFLVNMMYCIVKAQTAEHLFWCCDILEYYQVICRMFVCSPSM